MNLGEIFKETMKAMVNNDTKRLKELNELQNEQIKKTLDKTHKI